MPTPLACPSRPCPATASRRPARGRAALAAGLMLALVAGCAAPVATPAPDQVVSDRYSYARVSRSKGGGAFQFLDLLVGAHDLGGKVGICASVAVQDGDYAEQNRRLLAGSSVWLAGEPMNEDLSYAARVPFLGPDLRLGGYNGQPSACRLVDRPWRAEYATAKPEVRTRLN